MAIQNPLAPSPVGNISMKNLSVATVVKDTPGAVFTIAVTTAGSTTGAIYDASTTAGNIPANLVATVPLTVGNYAVDVPCNSAGILFEPGTSMVATVCFS